MDNSLILDTDTTASSTGQIRYAGFFVRWVANIIDAVVIVAIEFLMLVAFILVLYLLAEKDERAYMSPTSLQQLALGGAFVFLIIGIWSVWWLYYAICESRYGGTVGKLLLGLRVADMEGRSIGFQKASLRFFCRFASFCTTVYVGHVVAAFTDKKQSLYDTVSKCLVLKK